MQAEEGTSSYESTSYVPSSTASENLIYYYSHFELFSQRTHPLAYNKYNQFLIKLLRQLGQDWRYEANKLLKQSQAKQKSSSAILFDTSLSIWLQINRMKKHKSIDEANENVNYEMEYFELFFDRLYQRLSQQWKQLKDDNDELKQLAMGFFMTSCSTWEQMVIENKSSKGLLQSIADKLQKQILFNPLMLAKQKIVTFFTKKSKTQQKSQINNFNPKNFTKFKESLEQQQQLQHQMQLLKVEQQEQKSTQSTGKRKHPDSQKRVVFHKIPQQNPINQSILRKAYSYVLNSYQEQKVKWQVGKNFVTNIFEINYDKIMTKIKGETSNRNINVRVMKPAQDFYHTLMEVWLLFRTQSIVKFQDYLCKVKAVMGNSWNDKYMQPTKLFFSRLYQEWSLMMKGKEMIVEQDEQIIDIFVQRVKEQMKKNWEKDLTQKTNDLSDEQMKVQV